MFSTSIDTLEQREALIELLEHHFENVPQHMRRDAAGIELAPYRRTRRQIVVVRGNRIARRG